MAEMNAINHKSWLTWLGKALLAVAIIMVLSTVHGSSAVALSHIGPSSPGDRYNMTDDPTHQYRQLEVPVYFKDNPGSVRVFVEDTKWGGGASFNGVLIHGPGGEFTVENFQHDSSTGYWKGMVRAHMIGSAMFQFRLRLERSDGIIAYATGAASQASNYYNGDMDDTSGPFETKEMQMALPCSFTQPTRIGPGTPYHLILYDLDTWYHGWGTTSNGLSTINVRVVDDKGATVEEYLGKDYQCGKPGTRDYSRQCMGENGVLDVGMTMEPGRKYRILIGPTWNNNLIEYELPFDNIFYNISCEPNIDMRTTVDFTKKPTGDPEKQPRTGYKWLSSYGKYNSKDKISTKIEDQSIAEVMGYPGANKPNTPNKLWTWTGNYPHVIEDLPKAVMDENHHKAELYPGDELTWWFRAYNVGGSGFDSSPSTDFANYREGWIDSRQPGWNWNQTKPEPTWGVNVFMPSERGGPLNGEDGTHHQVMWGCYNWGGKCTDYFKGFDPSNLSEGVSISNQEAVEKHYRYIVKSGDAGQTLCQWLRMSWNNGSWQQRFTPKACVKIPYHYPPPPDDKDKHSGVVPTARVADGYKSKVQAGDDVQFSYSLTNTSGSGSTVSRQIEYRSYTFILRRGAKLPQNSEQKPYHYAKKWDGNGVGCGGRDIAPGAQGRCEQGVGGTSEKIYPGQTWPVPGGQPKYNVSGIWLAQPGDKICSYIAIDNNWSVKNDQSADTFRASNIACVVVTKSPNLNLSGSDSYAKDGFTGSDVRENIVPGTDKRGSYSQYGLLTGDKNGVTSFGSAGYTTASQANHKFACKLSYANTGSVKNDCKNLNGLQPAGLLKKPLSMPSSTNAKSSLGGSNVDLGGLPSGNYNYTGSGSLKIHGDLGKGTHITIFAEQADVTITGKIDADVGPYTKLSDIPSFTIMARNIKVEPGVERIAGTYVAKDRFESCNGAQEKGDTLGVLGLCRSKLKINGAIVSGGSPVFRRTFGAGNLQEDNQWKTDRISSTAEWIDYTPNLWLTTSNGSSGNQLEGLTTTQVTNLPVRY